mmetsp:Transcript_6501/g.5742  ORF Transcript_6501/g.5742 Transcript_6501/m.5742 type:complete len:462 (+) Transcript_6501:47-1432(+)|eukprot:CAMPEP_0201594302 /NCGR_PEP_ID=MMETSP0190_2-20130828/191655_1 /ASSEMBLY_ACC=CAM_ASM_000263 /TAXON_ID=37353 /ORGANISM="Rosalina sp." /LENGTH=461 /DNA_ID=CAMNT_0048053853 /DNA_START=33 /DNA_END=1418 /DNA_ORIENTATION=-
MWTFYLFVATISFIYGADNDYQDLGANLPTPLAEHITGVYNDYLYVFGGKNQTEFDEDGTLWNTKFWRLPLGNIALSGTDDITNKPTSSSWELLSVTAPTYGPASGNNEFACAGQCSAVIGKYLYIVGSYASAGNEFTATDTVYRLDLSTTPPTFAAQGAFPSTTGYGTATYGQCVTAINDVLYTVTGDSQADLVSLTSGTTQASLASYPAGGQFGGFRINAGCGGGNDDANLWLLGGTGDQNKALVYADDYEISGDSWTTRAFGNPGAFDNTDGTSTLSRAKARCISSFTNVIECAGGVTTSAKTTAIRYDTSAYITQTEPNSYSNLLFPTYSAGLNSIELLNDGTNAAELMIVTGGYDTTENQFTPPVKNTVQYAVRYITLPVPTTSPTMNPSHSPTMKPTTPPSRAPTCTGCTRAPSGSPTTAAPTTPSPTDAEPDSGVAQICVVFSCIMAFISVIII